MFFAGEDLTADALNEATGNTWTDYTPAWTASVAPAIGNGSLSAEYTELGRLVIVSFRLLAGSTTTFGSGEWSFSLPFPAAVVSPAYTGKPVFLGSSHSHDAGTAYWAGIVGIMSGASTMFLQSNNTTTKWGSATPFTWGNADFFCGQVAYKRAS